MYIEDRTTHTEVFRDIYREINFMCNALGNTARQRITFPSTIQKTLLRQREAELSGAINLARLVIQGDSPIPDGLASKIRETFLLVEKALVAK